MEFCSFDKGYIDRLRDGDSSTQQHFVAYFQQILGLTLRGRLRNPQRLDDIRQETFRRVLEVLKRDGGVRQPERFGAFVNSVCKNVAHEFDRDDRRNQTELTEEHLEPPDKIIDIEGALISQETKEKVRQILSGMAPRDRDLLRAVFLEEADKDEVCRRHGVDRAYLRVCLFRAKERFKEFYLKELHVS